MVKGTKGGAPKRHRRSRQRGAGLVEYALAGTFIVVTSLSAISALEGESEDALQARGNSIGSPDPDVPADTTTTTEEPSPGTTGTTATTAPPLPPDAAITSTEASTQGNKWTATVVVTITDGGAPVHKASITATWVRNPGGSRVDVQCTTLPNGTCTFTLKDMPTNGNSDHVASVDFTVNEVEPDGGDPWPTTQSATISEPA